MADNDRRSESSRHVHAELGVVRTEVKALKVDVGDMKSDVSDLNKAVVEHRVRLENGTHVFAGLRKDVSSNETAIEDLAERIRPKPPSIVKIVTLTLGFVAVGSAALWGLSNMLRDRPTVEQVDRVFQGYDEAHEAGGHRQLRDDVHSIQQEQALQSKRIGDVAEQQDKDSEKLDRVLERLPAPRRRRPTP